LDDLNDYVIGVHDSASAVEAGAWNTLLDRQSAPSPFMRHEYLAAMHASGSAVPASGWTPRFLTLTRKGRLAAACVLYLKDHSYGEYVFDWAWANAYEQHGLDYYPKGVVASPFTPVPGTRLLAVDDAARLALVDALVAVCRRDGLSSLHVLFGTDEDAQACASRGLMMRHTVQFHWTRGGWTTFDEFLGSLAQEKRKKIRQERRKVEAAGVTFRVSRGSDISSRDWDFFYRCYERTYHEHGNAPYLTRDFFRRMARHMPENWLLFIGERVDCLHFEACYYQPLQWCIEHGFDRFEGGAQGEHKMARALLPVKTSSAHWLAHPAFADAVEKFLEREGRHIGNYMEHLEQRTPFRQG